VRSAIFKMVGCAARSKASHDPRMKLHFSCIRYQGWLSLNYVNEFILPGMNMVQRRYGARWQAGQIHAKVPDAKEITQRELDAPCHP
jgi:hypothetical protein